MKWHRCMLMCMMKPNSHCNHLSYKNYPFLHKIDCYQIQLSSHMNYLKNMYNTYFLNKDFYFLSIFSQIIKFSNLPTVRGNRRASRRGKISASTIRKTCATLARDLTTFWSEIACKLIAFLKKCTFNF